MFIAFQFASAASYRVDSSHSQVHFTVKHLMISKVRGVFTEFEGQIEADPASKMLKSVKGVVQTASIDTREAKRDKHLRSDDFFSAAQHPTMTFTSKEISGSGDNITVKGDLTIRGNTKEVTLKGAFLGAVKDPWGNERVGFEASGEISRKDFGLKWNKMLETGGVVVGDNVKIQLEIEAIKQE
ncbi:MAG: polyisoprenoid-binding protein [SAR324 cluster bacterium]|nr:polyisoprenoid-binding protein [SAR324 cluster bacterium]